MFYLLLHDVYAWADGTSPQLVGQSQTIQNVCWQQSLLHHECIAPDWWNHVHVNRAENPADCVFRVLFSSEVLNHELWWKGPEWLQSEPSGCSKPPNFSPINPSDEEGEICLHATSHSREPIIPVGHYSSVTRLKRTTAWILRFANNYCVCESHRDKPAVLILTLTVQELSMAEICWLSVSQDLLANEIEAIKGNHILPNSSCLFVPTSLSWFFWSYPYWW